MDYPGGPKGITRVPESGRRKQKKRVRWLSDYKRKMQGDATLLALRMEKGAISQGTRAVSTRREEQGDVLP